MSVSVSVSVSDINILGSYSESGYLGSHPFTQSNADANITAFLCFVDGKKHPAACRTCISSCGFTENLESDPRNKLPCMLNKTFHRALAEG